MPYHVYVSNAGDAWLSHFLMDEDSGRLRPQPDLTLEGSPGAVATHISGDLLFVSLRSRKSFASYRVERSTGVPRLINMTALEDGSPYLSTDRTGRFLLAAYYGSGHVSVHAIDAQGALSPQPLQWISTAEHAHSIQTDPSNRFAFVPHTNPANAIYQFRFDAESGELRPNDPPACQPETPEGPRHFVFHPLRDLVYSVNENGSTVSVYRFDPQAGTLASLQVVSMLPPEGATDNTGAEIEISADGRHLYASNRGHDSLAVFSVGTDGMLQASGHVPTEATPRFFSLDPTGNFVHALGEKSGRLATYKRDAESGALEPLETHPVGKSPLWITYVAQS